MPAAKPSKAAISNAISAAQAAKAAGLTPIAIRIGSDGSLTIDIAAVEFNPAANQKPEVQSEEAPKKWGQKT
ncbi:MAG: hypothetical protein LC676_15560 [Loktanella sp.]|nr:hypothetical protein [Loktanella sp.]